MSPHRSPRFRLAWYLSFLALLSSCALLDGDWVKLAQDRGDKLFVLPESIKPHPTGKASDWETTFGLNFWPDREGWREANVDVVLHCATAPRVSYSISSVIGLTGTPGAYRSIHLDASYVSRLRMEPLLAKGYTEICNRPQARDSVAAAARQETAEQERQRADAAAAARAAQAERERRERLRAEEAERRVRQEAAARLRELDEQSRKAAEALRAGNDYVACDLARTAAETARGTDRLPGAVAAQARICAQHARLEEQRRLRLEAERAATQQYCQGAPRVPRELAESLAQNLGVNPLSLSFERLEASPGDCRMTVYHARGVARCWVELSSRGVIRGIGLCR